MHYRSMKFFELFGWYMGICLVACACALCVKLLVLCLCSRDVDLRGTTCTVLWSSMTRLGVLSLFGFLYFENEALKYFSLYEFHPAFSDYLEISDAVVRTGVAVICGLLAWSTLRCWRQEYDAYSAYTGRRCGYVSVVLMDLLSLALSLMALSAMPGLSGFSLLF